MRGNRVKSKANQRTSKGTPKGIRKDSQGITMGSGRKTKGNVAKQGKGKRIAKAKEKQIKCKRKTK